MSARTGQKRRLSRDEEDRDPREDRTKKEKLQRPGLTRNEQSFRGSVRREEEKREGPGGEAMDVDEGGDERDVDGHYELDDSMDVETGSDTAMDMDMDTDMDKERESGRRRANTSAATTPWQMEDIEDFGRKDSALKMKGFAMKAGNGKTDGGGDREMGGDSRKGVVRGVRKRERPLDWEDDSGF